MSQGQYGIHSKTLSQRKHNQTYKGPVLCNKCILIPSPQPVRVGEGKLTREHRWKLSGVELILCQVKLTTSA